MYPVVHFEMPYENVERVMKFYTTVFGWQMQKLDKNMGGYVLATTADKDAKPNTPRGAINGGFFPKKPDWPDQYPSVVIAVDNIEKIIKKIQEEKGKILGEPMEIPGIGLYVSFNDTEGNRVSILQPNQMQS